MKNEEPVRASVVVGMGKARETERTEMEKKMGKTGGKKRFLSLLLVLCLIVTYLPVGAFAEENSHDQGDRNQVAGFVSDDNGYIKYFVDIDTGGFYILPSDQSFDGTKAPSFGSFRIDGEEYTFGGDYPDSEFVLPPALGEEGTCQAEWRIGDIHITQFLNIIQNDSRDNSYAVYIRYEVSGEGGSEFEGRVLLDTMLGPDDTMPATLSSDSLNITNETSIAKNDMPEYYGLDVASEVTPQAYGLLTHETVTTPSLLTFAHFDNVRETVFDYSPDGEVNFTGSDDLHKADSAALLFFEMENDETEGLRYFSTIYGFDDLKSTSKIEDPSEQSLGVAAVDPSDSVDVMALPETYPFRVGTTGVTDPTIVSFGGMQWSVIGHNGVGVASEPGTLTLLANERSGSSFSYSNSSNTNYSSSALHRRLSGVYDALSPDEKSMVVERTLDGVTDYTYYPVEGPLEVKANFWALSKAEAEQVDPEVRKLAGNYNWWTRSWDPNTNYSMYIVAGASGGFPASEWTANGNNARAACIIDLSKVAFAMPADGKAVSVFDDWSAPDSSPSKPLKLTTVSNTLSLAIHDFSFDWNDVKCRYYFEEATIGSRLSAAIVSESGVVKYYTALEDPVFTGTSQKAAIVDDDESHEADPPYMLEQLRFPEGLDSTDRLLLFTETVNADGTIDLCSEPFEYELRPTLSAKIGDGFTLTDTPIYDGSASSALTFVQDESTFVGGYPAWAVKSLTLKDSNDGALDLVATNEQDGMKVTFEWPRDFVTFELESTPAKKISVNAKENVIATFFDEDTGLDITAGTAAANTPSVGMAAVGNRISLRLVAGEGTVPDSTITLLNASNNQAIEDVEGTYETVEGGRVYTYTFTAPDSNVVISLDTAVEELADYSVFTNVPGGRGTLTLFEGDEVENGGRIAPGMTVTVRVSDIDPVHSYFNGISVLNYISGSAFAIQAVTEGEEYTFTMPKHPVLVNLDVRQKPIYTTQVEKNQDASLEISNERSKETSKESVTGYKDETIAFLVTNENITKTITSVEVLNADTEEVIQTIPNSNPYADRFTGQFSVPGHNLVVRVVTEDAPAIAVTIAADLPRYTTITTPNAEILLGSKVAFQFTTADTRYLLYRPVMKVYDKNNTLLYESLFENETTHKEGRPVSYASAAIDKTSGIPARIVLDVQDRARVFTKELHSLVPNSTNAEIFKTIDVKGLNMYELDEGEVYFGTSPNPTQSAKNFITSYGERQLTITVPEDMLPNEADATYYVKINGVEKSCTVTFDRRLRTAPYSWLAVVSDGNNKHSVIFADSEAELMALKGSKTITMRIKGEFAYNSDWNLYQFAESPVLINNVATYTAPTGKHLAISETSSGVEVVGYGGKMSIPGYTFFDSSENITATLTNGIKYSDTWAKNSESAWINPNVQNIVFNYNAGGLNATVPGLGDGLSVTINNAVLLKDDVIFGGKLKMQLTNFKWDDKKEGVIETAKTLKMEKNGFEVDIKRLAYGASGFKGVEGAGSINLTSLEIPSLDLKSPSGKLEINTFDNIYSIEAKVDLKIGEVEGKLGLRPLNNGWPMIDEFKATIGFEPGVPVLPVAPVGHITNAGVGMDGLVDSLNGNFSAIPPIMFHVYGQFDLIKLLKIQDMSLNIGPSEISFSAKPKILGIDLFERFGGGLYIYPNGVKFDVGADLVILKGFEVIKGGGGIVISYLDRHFSFSGSLYAKIQVPGIHMWDWYAPEDGWKFWNWVKVGCFDIGPATLTDVYAGINDAGASTTVSVLGFGVKVEYRWGGSPSFSVLSVPGDPTAADGSLEVTQNVYDENGEFAGVASFGGNLSMAAVSGSNGKSIDPGRFSTMSFDALSLDQIKIINKQITIDEAYCDEHNVPEEERAEILGETYDDPRTHFVSFPEGIENDVEDYALLVTAPKDDITITSPDGSPFILKYATENDLNAAGCNATVFEGEGNNPTIMIRLPKEQGVWEISSSVPFGSSVIEAAPLPEVSKAQMGNKAGDKADLNWEVKNLSPDEEYVIEVRMATENGTDIANLDPGILLEEIEITSANDGTASGVYTISDEKLSAFESGEYYPVVTLSTVEDGLYNSEGEQLESGPVKLPRSTLNSGSMYPYSNPMQPDPVSEIALVATGSGSFNAEWRQVADADGYVVSVFDKDGNPIYEPIGSGENASTEPAQMAYDIPVDVDAEKLDVDLGGLTPGMEYYVEVAAYRTTDDNGSRFYGGVAQSNTLLLPVPEYPVITVDLPGEGLSLDDEGNKVFYANSDFSFSISASQSVKFTVQQDGEDIYSSSDFESRISLPFQVKDLYSTNISILATNASGDSSHSSFIVYVDDVAPPLFVVTDENGVLFSNVDGEYVITGQSEPFATITDDLGNTVQANESGDFSLMGTLAANVNDTPRSIRASDLAGNTESAEILIKRLVGGALALESISIVPSPKATLFVGESLPVVIKGKQSDGSTIEIPANAVTYDVREGAGNVTVDDRTGRVTAIAAGKTVLAVSLQTNSGILTSEELTLLIKEVGDTSPDPSSEKDVTGVTTPSGALISGAEITASVANTTTSVTVGLSVSTGASWKLYSDPDCTQEIANKVMVLAVGENTAYVKVTAEDGSIKIYTLTITRASTSDPQPIIYDVVDHFGTWTGSGTVSAKVDADHAKFEKLTLGNTEIDAQDYAITQGSTVITLSEDHLKTYSDGTHTFVAHFSDGHSKDILLTVDKTTQKDTGGSSGPSKGGSTTTSTGDGFTPLPLVVLASVTGIVLLVLARRYVRSQHNKR